MLRIFAEIYLDWIGLFFQLHVISPWAEAFFAFFLLALGRKSLAGAQGAGGEDGALSSDHSWCFLKIISDIFFRTDGKQKFYNRKKPRVTYQVLVIWQNPVLVIWLVGPLLGSLKKFQKMIHRSQNKCQRPATPSPHCLIRCFD